MQKITIFNENNQALEIEIIRYFKKDDKKYLIFSLGEKDEQGYIKVYVSKILGLNGTLAAYDIIDETEWANVKELVKKIIKANREGTSLEIVDLTTERLNNIKINGQQVFKLIGNLIELLGSNVNEVKDELEEEIAPVTNTSEVDTQELSSSEETEENSNTSVEETTPVEIETNDEVSNETNEYEKLYKDLFEQYQSLVAENAELKTKLAAIKSLVQE